MHDVNATVYSACFFLCECVCVMFLSQFEKKYHPDGPAKEKVKLLWSNIKILVLYKT